MTSWTPCYFSPRCCSRSLILILINTVYKKGIFVRYEIAMNGIQHILFAQNIIKLGYDNTYLKSDP